MGSKQQDLTGKRFGLLTVIQKTESRTYGKTKKRRWICLCDCGSKSEKDTGSLTSGRHVSCGCQKIRAASENSRKSRYKVRKETASFNVMKGSYKRGAAIRGVEWALSDEDTKKLFNGNCFYCGSVPSNNYKTTYYNMKYSGIDRIDNTLGYTVSNTVSCCKICNHAKHTMSQNNFIDWILMAAKHISSLERIIKDLENA